VFREVGRDRLQAGLGAAPVAGRDLELLAVRGPRAGRTTAEADRQGPELLAVRGLELPVRGMRVARTTGVAPRDLGLLAVPRPEPLVVQAPGRLAVRGLE
jgi:hypothetical protein